MAQWIRQATPTSEVPGSNHLVAAVFAIGQVTLSTLPRLIPRRGLKADGPLITCLQAAYFLNFFFQAY